MNKIRLAILVFGFMLSSVTSLFLVTDVQALTKAEKQACYERWAGRSQGQAGGPDAKSFDEKTFKETACAKEETCKIERYEDGAVIHCMNVVTGKFDSQNVKNRPSTNDGEKPGQAPSCGELKTSIISCDTSGGNPILNMILVIVNFLAVGVGIAVVGGIIWGGMIYATSNGDASKTKQAVSIIVNAVIGLLLFMFMYAILNYLIPGGLFA